MENNNYAFKIGDAVKVKKPIFFEDSFDYAHPECERTLRIAGTFTPPMSDEYLYILVNDNPIFDGPEKEKIVQDTVVINRYGGALGTGTICRLCLHEHIAYASAHDLCPPECKLEQVEVFGEIVYREVNG